MRCSALILGLALPATVAAAQTTAGPAASSSAPTSLADDPVLRSLIGAAMQRRPELAQARAQAGWLLIGPEVTNWFPGARVLSSDDHRLYGGLIAFELKTPAWPAIHAVLKQKRVWHIAAEHTRLSTHIHTRPRDIEEFFSIVRDGLKRA